MVVEEFEGGRYLLLALWDHDGDRGQEEVEDAAGVVAEAAVAVAGVSAGEAGGGRGGAGGGGGGLRVWWLRPRWRSRGSALERRGEIRVGRPRLRAAWALSRAAMPPWPRVVSEPMMPGPGPTRIASQLSWVAAASSAPTVVRASCSPPYAGAAVT